MPSKAEILTFLQKKRKTVFFFTRMRTFPEKKKEKHVNPEHNACVYHRFFIIYPLHRFSIVFSLFISLIYPLYPVLYPFYRIIPYYIPYIPYIFRIYSLVENELLCDIVVTTNRLKTNIMSNSSQYLGICCKIYCFLPTSATVELLWLY